MERYSNWPEHLSFAGKGTHLDMARIQDEASRLQAVVNAQVMKAVFGGLARASRWLVAATAQVLRALLAGVAACRLHNELSYFSDAQLAQLGIARGDIARYVFDIVDTASSSDRTTRGTRLNAVPGGRSTAEAQLQESPRRRAA